MNDKHPITPPPELVEQWLAEPEYVSGWNGKCTLISVTDHRFSNICAKAAQWGADQELEACCVLMDEWGLDGNDLMECRRRPKPPSLKEQALKELDDWTLERHGLGGECFICDGLSVATIRRALEALPQ
jgi:hypothetical protein